MASLSQRTPQQSARREEIEASLLASTESLLAQGTTYADLKVEQIATRAGISRTAFYFYFRDKRELLMRLTEDVSEQLYRQADAWWSASGSGREGLRQALERVIDLYAEHGLLLRAVVEASAYDETVAVLWRELIGRFTRASRARIEAEQAQGAIDRTLPAEATAFALIWMTERACYQQVVRARDLRDPDFSSALTRVWLGALYGAVQSRAQPSP